CVIRVNDRRILFGLLEHCGFTAEEQAGALITIDKLDKIGVDGVTDELSETNAEAAAAMRDILTGVDAALEAGIPVTRDAISAVLPAGAAEDGVESLVTLGEALDGGLPSGVEIRFDPTLVRGMGYYTGTIFEIAHPGSGSSVGGGGRYDGMIGRFLGQDVPAVGFSIGFERVVDLIEVDSNAGPEAVALVADTDVSLDDLMALKRALVADGLRVRLEKRQKNMKTLVARLEGEGFTRLANVRPGVTDVSELSWRNLGE
ncbi:MAG: ATP phosphoribosyltransferase regulatory subunit, partial [Leucobacter sp.]|nr:ATP phosphoribosyltransferase regulatory subunit [Leucobacter sp.]